MYARFCVGASKGIRASGLRFLRVPVAVERLRVSSSEGGAVLWGFDGKTVVAGSTKSNVGVLGDIVYNSVVGGNLGGGETSNVGKAGTPPNRSMLPLYPTSSMRGLVNMSASLADGRTGVVRKSLKGLSSTGDVAKSSYGVSIGEVR